MRILWMHLGAGGECRMPAVDVAALESAGYAVEKAGPLAEALQSLQRSPGQPQILLLEVTDAKARPLVLELVRWLESDSALPPLLLGGGGVDEDYALEVALSAEAVPYRGGVYYFADDEELLAVLRNVISFRPASVTHGTGGDPRRDGCASCSGCQPDGKMGTLSECSVHRTEG